MRKWGIEDWILMLLLAIAMGIVGTWYFGQQLKDGISQLI